MKELSHIESGMQFYGQMPDEYAMILNSDHRLIKEIKDEAIKAVGDALAPVDADLKGLEARMAAIRQSQEKKKADEITDEDRKQRKDCEDEISKRREERKKILADFAAGNKPLHQLIDLALLENHMLSGEALAKFVTRSIDMIK
jgi:molecular chaperone HtpG